MESTAPNSTDPARHEALGYDDDQLSYPARYIKGHQQGRAVVKELPDPTYRAAMRDAVLEDAKLPPAPRYIWKGQP